MQILVRVIAKRTLREFWEQPRHRDAERPLRAWYEEARAANWRTPHDIKTLYRQASFLTDNRVVFNIAGNKYRLITALNYAGGIVFIRFVGTHKDYDRISQESLQ